ncbi:cytochrome P450 [Striga asiatica]|uniref:Cytochrome P450 n=1 Tax=Striga asiatica TaxID=4170 RepID=A0A5A7PTI5_STRAF|nr:cytochrome P450 [Striga asiatica]
MTPILLASLIILPLLLILCRKSRKTQGPPGPPGLPFLGNLHQFDTRTPHIYLWRLSCKYGPLMSMKLGSIPVLVISSPKMAKEVLKTNDLTFSSRPKLIGQAKLSYDHSDIAFAPYTESWRELRKICVVHLLSNKHVQSFRPVREKEVFRMVEYLSGKAGSGEAVNLSETLLSLTSTLICKVAFGKMEGLERRKFDELMIEAQVMQTGFSFLSDYLPWFGWVDRMRGLVGRLDKVCKDFDEFYEEIIGERLGSGRGGLEKDPNILDLLIRLKEEKLCSIDLTWNHVKAILMNIFIAGSEPSVATTVWTMTALLKNPAIMTKLQKHIRESVGDKGKVNEDDLPNLHFLKAVVKESLRLYPPTPLLLPRETLDKCTINGYTIPPKTLVYINAWAISRDPKYWENPEKFQPERFLDTNIDFLGQNFEVIPFGSGRRGCPGMAMGLVTVEILLANLLYSFDWELPSGMKKEDVDTEVLPGLTMHKKNPLCLVPKQV